MQPAAQATRRRERADEDGGRELLNGLALCAWWARARALETVSLSAALASLLDLPAGDPAPLEAIVHAGDLSRLRAALREVAESGEARSAEYRALRSGGTTLPVVAALRPWKRGAGGEVSEIITILVVRSGGSRDAEDEEVRVLHAGFESYPEGLLLVRGDGTVARWNRRFAELWGATETLDENAVLRLAVAQVEGGEVFFEEVRRGPVSDEARRIECRDGRVLECSVRTSPAGRVWTFCDVSERMRMESAMLVNERRYRQLYDQTPVMMHSIDRAGRLVSVSDAWLRTLGYERDDVLGRLSTDFLTPESRQYALDTVLPDFYQAGECRDIHYRMQKKNGDIIDVVLDAIAERDPDGTHRRSLAVITDVTERLRTEAERDRLLVRDREARESAESALALLDALFHTAPVGLAFLDRDLRYVRVNETFRRQFHHVASEVSKGRTVWEEVVPTVAPTIAPILLRVMETREPVTGVEVPGAHVGPQGERQSILASFYPVSIASGELLGVGVIGVDNTLQKRAATLQAQLYREARQAVRVRDEFLATMSHELRTPMTPLVIYLQLLQQEYADEANQRAMLDNAVRQVGKLRALIDDLLDSARVDAGGLRLEKRRVAIARVAEETVSSARVAHPQHALELELPESEPTVFGDERRIAQVLSNLIENAMKYSKTDAAVRVSVVCRGAEVVVSVADQGIGIPADEVPKLFDRFFRARNAPVSQYGGLGLGLYICRDIVELLGGRIWADSELGRGSRFHVALPLAEEVVTAGNRCAGER